MSQFRILFCLGFVAACSTSVCAAPPAITYLYPAGTQRGTSVEVTMGGAFDPWPPKFWVSDKAITVVAGKDKGKLTVTAAKDAVPGVYWLRSLSDEGVSGLRPFLVGLLPDVNEVEPNNDSKKPQLIEGNVVVNGRFDKNHDVDCYGVTLKKGQTLIASLEAHETLKSPVDAILQIVEADGFVVVENHDFHGLDPQIVFTAPKDGTYTVRAFAFPSSPNSSIHFYGSDASVYRLTLTTGPYAEFAVPLAATEAQLKASGFRVEGWNLPKGLRLSNPIIPAGSTHATLFAPELANPLRVRIQDVPCTVCGEPEGKPVPYQVPFTVTGRLATENAIATFKLPLKKNRAIRIGVESRSLGLTVNPVIEVSGTDEKGKFRRFNHTEQEKPDDDAASDFTAPVDGEYTVAVNDIYGGGGGPRDFFLLRVTPQVPDYELTVTADRFTIVPGKPTVIPVKIARAFGFAKPVEVVAEGLPAGIKFEITPPAKPDPNARAITLTADKPVSGMFRLVGRVKEQPKLNRVVRARVPEWESLPIPDLWVTVANPPPAPPKK